MVLWGDEPCSGSRAACCAPTAAMLGCDPGAFTCGDAEPFQPIAWRRLAGSDAYCRSPVRGVIARACRRAAVIPPRKASRVSRGPPAGRGVRRARADSDGASDVTCSVKSRMIHTTAAAARANDLSLFGSWRHCPGGEAPYGLWQPTGPSRNPRRVLCVCLLGRPAALGSAGVRTASMADNMRDSDAGEQDWRTCSPRATALA